MNKHRTSRNKVLDEKIAKLNFLNQNKEERLAITKKNTVKVLKEAEEKYRCKEDVIE